MKKNSGQSYTLKMLLAGEKNDKIVIPDLQRDYCWGSTGTLVDEFMLSLYEHFKHSQTENLLMGLIYGYYESVRPYLQLCDGQQRLTTLYLIMGMICRLTGKSEFRDLLISDFELNEDDCEPRLLYAVRDSSMYFLSDLVCKYFMAEMQDGETPSEVIKALPWWFSEYSNDPTINNILDALDKIKKKIDLFFSLEKNERISDFGQFLMDKLEFIYYDMGGRKDGEETFVIINTTGEPLTSTENLKPLVVTQKTTDSKEWERRSAIWEKIDNYFWKHRPEGDDTSDAGMKEFLRLVLGVYNLGDKAYYQLLTEKNYKFPMEKSLKSINGKNLLVIDCMDELYHVVCRLKDDSKELVSCPLLPIRNDYAKMNLNDYFVILPVLRYCVKFPKAKVLEIKRVYAFFENLKRYKTIVKENNNILLAIQAIDKLPTSDIISLLQPQVKDNIDKTYILTTEEKLRFEIYKRFPTKRCDIEEAFNAISSHPVLQGQIECLIKHFEDVKESEDFDFSSFDFDVFKKYVEVFMHLFNAENDNQLVSDLTMISIACIEGIVDNPIEDGDKCDFLYRKDQWNNFFCNNKRNWEKLGGYFKRLIAANDVKTAQQKVIEEWLQKDRSKDCRYYNFIKYFKENGFEQIVFANANDYWQNKRLVISTPLRKGDSSFVRVRYRINYNWQDFYLFGTRRINCGGRDGWKNLECYVGEDGSCLYIDHMTYNIAIDFLYDKESDKGQLRIFARDDSTKKDGSEILNKIFEKYCLKETLNDGRHVTPMMTTEELIAYFKKIREFIDAEIGQFK